jgi:hypothetical protein
MAGRTDRVQASPKAEVVFHQKKKAPNTKYLKISQHSKHY